MRVIDKEGRLIGQIEEYENGFIFWPIWDGKSGVVPSPVVSSSLEELVELVKGEVQDDQ